MDITKLEPFLQGKHFLFRLNAINAIVHFGNAKNVSLLISLLQDEDYNIISAATEAIVRLADRTFLPYFQQKLAGSSDNKITRIILAIQARCEFYNYDIFRFLPIEIQSSQSASAIYIDRIGILNTGFVNLQNQIGIQQPEQPK